MTRRLDGRPLAPSTRAAYAGDWRAWAAWCDARGEAPLPLRWPAVEAWLVASSDAGARLATLRRRVVALSVTAQLGGPERFADGLTGPGAQPVGEARPPQTTRNVLANLAREQARAGARGERRAAPCLARHLRAMCRALDGDGADDRRDRVLLSVGWFGCLRPSELASARWEDLNWKDTSAVLRLGASKTNQQGADEWVELPAGLEEATCPLRALRAWAAWCEAAGLPAHGPILRAVAKGGRIGRPLSRHAVAARIAVLAERAGLGDLGLTGHSLRRGAVTEAVGAGVPASLVRAQSRHRSVEVFERYVDRAALANRVPTAGLA